MYTHFKRYLCKMCILFWHPLYIYIYMYRRCQKMYTHQRVTKKCIHILRDIIYVKCVYIFLAPSVCVGFCIVSYKISDI